MKREIKFRGKRLDNGEWVYGYYVKYNDYSDNIHESIIDEYGYMYDVDLATVGQYTGLKDKNGKEIYEGDLFHAGYFGGNDVVLWDKENARYIGKTPHGYISYVGREPSAEIVGNIHDHPELINKADI